MPLLLAGGPHLGEDPIQSEGRATRGKEIVVVVDY